MKNFTKIFSIGMMVFTLGLSLTSSSNAKASPLFGDKNTSGEVVVSPDDAQCAMVTQAVVLSGNGCMATGQTSVDVDIKAVGQLGATFRLWNQQYPDDNDIQYDYKVARDTVDFRVLTFTASATGTYTLWVSQENDNCTESPRKSVTFSVFQVPAIDNTSYSLSGTATYCEGSSFSVSLSGSQNNSLIQYYLQHKPTGGSTFSDVSGAAAFDGNGSGHTWTSLTDGGTYRVEARTTCNGLSEVMPGQAVITLDAQVLPFTFQQVGEACDQLGPFVMEVPSPEAGVTYFLYKTGDINQDSIPRLYGNSNEIRWQVNDHVSYTMAAFKSGVCATSTVEELLTPTFSGRPSTPSVVNSATIAQCIQTTVDLQVSNLIAENVTGYLWYKDAPTGTPVANTNGAATINVPVVLGTTSYYAWAQNSNGCLSTTAMHFQVTGNDLPDPPAHASTMEVCYDATLATLSLTDITNDGTYRLYDAAIDGTLIDSGVISLVAPITTNSQTFHIERENGDGCISETRTPVTITKMAAPQAYTLEHLSLSAYCENTSLRLSGSETGVTYTLYRDGVLLQTKAGDGNVLLWDTITLSGLYKVGASKGSCGIIDMTNELPMIIDQVSPYGVTGGGVSCELDGSQVGLSNSQSGIQYYLKRGDEIELATLKYGTGAPLSWPGLKTSGSYGVVAYSSGCGYTDMNQVVTVDVTPVPEAPIVPDLIIYQSGTNGFLEASHSSTGQSVTYNWYEANGTFLFSGTRNNLTNITQSQSYLVEAVINGCPSERIEAFVVFTLAAPPGVPSHVTACEEHYLRLSGTVPNNVTWYWQHQNSMGTDKSLDASKYDYRLVKSGNYYIRAYDNLNKMWGPGSTASGHINLADPSRVTPVSCDDIQAQYITPTPAPYNASAFYNYVNSYDVLRPGMTEAQILSETDNRNVLLNSTFVDGIGRPLQTVSRGTSPTAHDVVQMMHYDGFGRGTFQYLPYVSTETDGSIKADPFDAQHDFYAGNVTAGITAHFPNEGVFYGQTILENSPVNRPLISMSPGDAWSGSGVGVTNDYDVNTFSDSVRIWDIGSNGLPESLSGAVYQAGELAVMTTADEDGNTTRDYTNKLGQVILKKVQQLEVIGEGHAAWLNTYYVYDDFGNLRFIMPPRAVEILEASNFIWNSSAMDALAFQYTYDERARMVTKKVPGAGEVRMVYDVLDRLMLSQDANQRDVTLHDPAQWSFTKYDEQGRAAITGFYYSSLAQDSLQSLANNWDKEMAMSKTLPDLAGVVEGSVIVLSSHIEGTTKYQAETEVKFLPGFESDEAINATIGGTFSTDFTSYMGYQDATFPLLKSASYEVLTVNYFDDYDFTNQAYQALDPGFHAEVANDPLNAVSPEQYPYVQGIATGSRVKVLDSEDDWLTSVMYYDDRGRVVQSQGNVYTGGQDIATTQFDFSGKTLLSYLQHHNVAAGSEGTTNVLAKYDYDVNGRLITHLQKLNSNASYDTLFTHEYNSLGELATKRLGANPSNPLETLDYDYNIRGWLQGVNRGYVSGALTDRFFGMDMRYEAGYNKNNRNGNISGIQWKTRSSSAIRSFGYDYDHSNRLLKSDYGQHGGLEANWSNTHVDFSTLKFYDANGNILGLARWGVVAGSRFLIDDLVYEYGAGYETAASSNQLLAVQDASPDAAIGGFKDNNLTNADYVYDANGNMTLDHNKGITAIDYNHLNLPKLVTFTGGRSISYTYDAAGIKLRKLADDNGVATMTDYIGGFIYENNDLEHFAHAEGRVRKKNSGELVYDYFIKDHLGNTRMTLTEDQDSTIYLATMETDLTPTGVDLAAFEESLFLNLTATRDSTLIVANHSSETGINNNETARLNGNDPGRRVGPAKLLVVSPGDKVSLEVFAYHQGGYTSGGSISQGSLVTALAAAFGGVNGAANTESQAIYDLFDQNAALAHVGLAGDANMPQAYLNYIQLDQDFDYVDGGFVQVSDSANVHQQLNVIKTIDQGGYIYVYLSAESQTDFNVHFDDLRVVHTKGAILQEDHYYPFGLSISALSGSAPLSKLNHFKYNGKELDNIFDLGWYHYGARMYDPQIARFTTMDPLAAKYSFQSPYAYAANNPVLFIDYMGLGPSPWNKLVRSFIDMIDYFRSDNVSSKEKFETFSQIVLPVKTMNIMFETEASKNYTTEDYIEAGIETLEIVASIFSAVEVKVARMSNNVAKLADDAGDFGKRSGNLTGNGLVKNKLAISGDGKLMGEISGGEFKMNGNTKAAGEFDFVVTAEGQTLLGRKHSFLSGGADVQAAGTMKIRNGKVVNVTNLSGHYTPTLEQSSRFLNILKNQGVDVSSAHLKVYDESGQVIKHVVPNGND